MNYNTSVKKKENSISDDFLSEIKRKSQGEPAWLKEISSNLIKENELANQSGIQERINESKKRLESFNIDLDGFNEMPAQRKSQQHIVDFTKERYKPKTNWNNDRGLYKPPMSRNGRDIDKGFSRHSGIWNDRNFDKGFSISSRIGDGKDWRKHFGKENVYPGTNDDEFYIYPDGRRKHRISHQKQQSVYVLEKMLKELGFDRNTEDYERICNLLGITTDKVYRPGQKKATVDDAIFRYDRDGKPEVVKYSNASDNKGRLSDVIDGAKNIASEVKEKWKESKKALDNETKIKKDPGYVDSYQTDMFKDYSKTYGVTVIRDIEDDLGIDTVSTRKGAAKMISDSKDEILGAAKKYGVDPIVLAGCIFTEQACNVTAAEGITDKAKYIYDGDASFGIGQVMVSTAKTLEQNGYIKEKIISAGKDKNGKETWYVPGVGKIPGTYEDAIKARLENPEQNIEYVAAYLAMHKDNWMKNADVDLTKMIDVWATLFNIDHNEEKGYHSNPGSNDFGKYVRANSGYIMTLLGLLGPAVLV